MSIKLIVTHQQEKQKKNLMEGCLTSYLIFLLNSLVKPKGPMICFAQFLSNSSNLEDSSERREMVVDFNRQGIL